jgi:hypothetical protein
MPNRKLLLVRLPTWNGARGEGREKWEGDATAEPKLIGKS